MAGAGTWFTVELETDIQICIAGHNCRWIDRSIPILPIDTIGHADHQ
jgi:hypothetical protein